APRRRGSRRQLPEPRVARAMYNDVPMGRALRTVALFLAPAIVCAHDAGAAAPRWTIVRSESMDVIGDAPADTLRDVAIQLEQFRTVLAGLIRDAQRPLPVPTVVYVFGARRALEPFLPVHNGKVAAIGGYSHRDPDVNYIALSLEGYEDTARIVFHEYTHLLVRNAARTVPVWLNEGLAEYYSTYLLKSKGQAADIGHIVPSHVRLLRDRFMPLSDLIGVDASSELYDETARRSIFYAEA